MNLSAIFGDDEHTAADGAYIRLLKSRKWLYASASASALVGHHLVVLDKLNRDIKYVMIPDWLIHQIMLASLLYLLSQYGLLLYQTALSYRNILDDRFNSVRKVALDNALEEVQNFDQSLKSLNTQLIYTSNTLARDQLENQIEVAKMRLDRWTEKATVLSKTSAISSGFKISEIAIDALRSGPPVIFALYAVYLLLR